jgi:ATP-dependent HslUV protease subunit HslV
MVVKHRASKIRRMCHGAVLGGFAGSAADGMALFEKLEARLDEHRGNLLRAAHELAKDWRSDRALRRLDAQLIACDRQSSLLISGTGDVLVPDDGVLAIGSGAPSALGAARALLKHSELSATEIVHEALHIAAEISIYTNHELVVESLSTQAKDEPDA